MRVNFSKLDSRDPEKRQDREATYLLRQDRGTLRTSVPYDAITAFGIPNEKIPVSDYRLELPCMKLKPIYRNFR